MTLATLVSGEFGVLMERCHRCLADFAQGHRRGDADKGGDNAGPRFQGRTVSRARM